MRFFEKKGEVWICNDCGTDAAEAKIANPIFISKSGMNSGDFEYNTVSYCPKCDKKPNYYGNPVYI